MEKREPTNKQINDFFEIFRIKAESALVVDEEITSYQMCAFKDYGGFLALVGEENYEKVAQEIILKLFLYNAAIDERLMDSFDHNKINKGIGIVSKCKNYLSELNCGIYAPNKNEKRFQELILELENVLLDLVSCKNKRLPEFIPIRGISKHAKKTKSGIEKCLKDIVSRYKIIGYSNNIKKLKNKLNVPPQ